jgi:hypothetical protein
MVLTKGDLGKAIPIVSGAGTRLGRRVEKVEQVEHFPAASIKNIIPFLGFLYVEGGK